MAYPDRIVCLTEETVETLYLLGEERRIAGVSGYAVRPSRVRREKPRVSAFITADVPKILALKPDLILTFSDLQADIAAELIRQCVAVHAFNQRDVAGILDMIRTLGALVGAAPKADELAGGIYVFGTLALGKSAKERIVTAEQVVAARPDIILGSWCGKKFVPKKVAARPGFDTIPAVRDGFLREIKSPLILQPGPAALTDGLDALEAIIAEWARQGASRVA